jgi:hypothetical protein
MTINVRRGRIAARGVVTSQGSAFVRRLDGPSQEISLPQPNDQTIEPGRERRARRPSPPWIATSRWRLLVAPFLVAVLTGLAGVSTNVLGAGDRFEGLVRRVDRFLAGPVPDRSTRPTIIVTPPPETPAPSAQPTVVISKPGPSGSSPAVPVETREPVATPTPTPVRASVDVDIVKNHEVVFAHELDKTWCAVAGTQMVLAIHGKAPTTDDFQRQLARRIREWESREDSHNGNWGPAAMSLALEAYGVPGYEVRAYDSRGLALRDAAKAIGQTGAPVILLTWRGAHTWVMTGFRADGHPAVFPDARVSGTYILDPWYPWNSSIWGQSDKPGHFEDAAEMKRNYLPWKRPEGKYPDRDGKFIALVPTVPLAP